jgi:hypothetical protein
VADDPVRARQLEPNGPPLRDHAGHVGAVGCPALAGREIASPECSLAYQSGHDVPGTLGSRAILISRLVAGS